MLKFQPKVIWDSNPDCQINPDVCQISPKMLWIHYLVGVSHFYRFVKIGQWPSEMLINLLKSPILQWWGNWKSNPESVSGPRASPKVNQFFRLAGLPSHQVSMKSARYLFSNPAHRMTDRQRTIT